MNLLDLPLDLLCIIFADLKEMHPHIALIHKTIYENTKDTIVDESAYCFCANISYYNNHNACNKNRMAVDKGHIRCTMAMANQGPDSDYFSYEPHTGDFIGSNIDCFIYAVENNHRLGNICKTQHVNLDCHIYICFVYPGPRYIVTDYPWKIDLIVYALYRKISVRVEEGCHIESTIFAHENKLVVNHTHFHNIEHFIYRKLSYEPYSVNAEDFVNFGLGYEIVFVQEFSEYFECQNIVEKLIYVHNNINMEMEMNFEFGKKSSLECIIYAIIMGFPDIDEHINLVCDRTTQRQY